MSTIKILRVLCKFIVPSSCFLFRISYSRCCCFFCHFIDIEPGIDEKGAAKVLEESVTSVIPPGNVCVFTVAHNAFIGLECTELTCYDVIIVTKELPHFAGIDFKNVLNAVGCPTPIVLLVDENDPITDYDIHHLGFFCPLKKPFSMATLCSVLQRVITRQISSSSSSSQPPPFDGTSSYGTSAGGASGGSYSNPPPPSQYYQEQQLQIQPYNNSHSQSTYADQHLQSYAPLVVHPSSNGSHSHSIMQLPPQVHHHTFQL